MRSDFKGADSVILKVNPFEHLSIRMLETDYGTVLLSYKCLACAYDSARTDGKTFLPDETLETLMMFNERHLTEIHGWSRYMFKVL